MDISVIIPAYNEEKYIYQTATIKRWMPSNFSFEVIVVDHGSSDKTVAIAIECGVTVVDGKGLKTIAALRNLGVKQAKGKILFFIDADITFSQQWSNNITDVVLSLQDDPNQICGSLPIVPEDSSKLMKYWFNPNAMEEKPKYIGSCHLLTSRYLFDKVGGFPEEMETAEDYTFCLNAAGIGAKLSACPELVVVHHGAPNTFTTFVKREIWHGRGDWTNISSVLSSKVAILTLFFIFAHLMLAWSLLFYHNLYGLPYLIVAFILSICLFSSVFKFSKHGVLKVFVNACIYYVYFFSRSLSLFSVLFSKKFKKRSRVN